MQILEELQNRFFLIGIIEIRQVEVTRALLGSAVTLPLLRRCTSRVYRFSEI